MSKYLIYSRNQGESNPRTINFFDSLPEAEAALQKITEEWEQAPMTTSATSLENIPVELAEWEVPFHRATSKDGHKTAGLANSEEFGKVMSSYHLLHFPQESVPEWLQPNYDWVKAFMKKNGAEPISEIIKNI